MKNGRLPSSSDDKGVTTVATADLLHVEAELFVKPRSRPTR
jgi:hypothetical protein